MKENFQLLCDREILKVDALPVRPRLLLHSCCGPCSSYVLEYLSAHFDTTILFFNPNIYPEEEFLKRLDAQRKVIENIPFKSRVNIVEYPYNHNEFLQIAKGLEAIPEGGERCTECFRLRLSKTAEFAKENSFDYFTTTLSVSPHKNSEILNEIGFGLGKQFGVSFLMSDFKKRNGYKRSIELSKEFNLYRQSYCGCEFSIN